MVSFNWRFWVKKRRPCFGYYDALVLPSEAYMAKRDCGSCENNQKMECFLKSLKPIAAVVCDGIDLELWK
jgi:hypothetical protein